MIYIIEGMDIRRCKQIGRHIVRDSYPKSLRTLNYTSVADINQNQIIRELRHCTGDPFQDTVFGESTALQISESEADRLINLDAERTSFHHREFLACQEMCARNRDRMISTGEYDTMPPDERSSLDRAAGVK